MNLYGLLIGAATFMCIGIFHPVVIKAEYYWGVRCWWFFLLLGLGCIAGSLFVSNDILSTLLGVLAFSSLWSIIELFKQRKRVEKGWFPRNPRRKSDHPKNNNKDNVADKQEQNSFILPSGSDVNKDNVS